MDLQGMQNLQLLKMVKFGFELPQWSYNLFLQFSALWSVFTSTRKAFVLILIMEKLQKNFDNMSL